MGQGKGRGKRGVSRERVNKMKEKIKEESERELKEYCSLKVRQKLKVWTSGRRKATSSGLWPKSVSVILALAGSMSVLILMIY